jgi:peptidylprolyl isomerase/FKBP-type peptidyl-prolyl cis-trans isomerase FklB
MNKYIFYLIAIAAAIISFTSCSKDDDKSVENWLAANMQAFQEIKSNSEYKEIKSPGNESSIYYKVLTKGNGTKPIYYTSTVTIYLKGWYVVDYTEFGIKKNDIFQRWLFDDGIPYSTSVGSGAYLVNGQKVALQNMVKGDKWEIWIPYQLATGSSNYNTSPTLGASSGSVTIPAYSTLVYEIEVVDIITE